MFTISFTGAMSNINGGDARWGGKLLYRCLLNEIGMEVGTYLDFSTLVEPRATEIIMQTTEKGLALSYLWICYV